MQGRPIVPRGDVLAALNVGCPAPGGPQDGGSCPGALRRRTTGARWCQAGLTRVGLAPHSPRDSGPQSFGRRRRSVAGRVDRGRQPTGSPCLVCTARGAAARPCADTRHTETAGRGHWASDDPPAGGAPARIRPRPDYLKRIYAPLFCDRTEFGPPASAGDPHVSRFVFAYINAEPCRYHGGRPST